MHCTPLMPAGFFRRFQKKLLDSSKERKGLGGGAKISGDLSREFTLPGDYLREGSLF